MSGIVVSKLNIRGSGLVGSLGTDGQHMLSAGAGKTNVFETAAAGGVTPVVSAYASGNQAVTTGTWTQIVLDTEEVDSDGVFASNTFTAPSDGNYFVSTSLKYQFQDGQQNNIAIYKEGSSYIERYNVRYDGGIEKVEVLSAIVNLDATEEIKIYYLHNRGSNNTVYGDSAKATRVDIFKVN